MQKVPLACDTIATHLTPRPDKTIRMIRQMLRRRYIRRYIRRLGPALAKRYGRSKTYTPGQVKATVERLGVSYSDICYGYASYCTSDDFAEVHASMGETCNYDAMRSEIIENHFGGDHSAFESSAYEFSSHGDGGGGEFGGHDGGGALIIE